METTARANTSERRDYGATLQQRGEELKERARELDSRTRSFVMERPFVAVGGALAVGFLIARLLRR